MLEIFSTIICELVQKNDQGYLFVHNKELIYVSNNELSWRHDLGDTILDSLYIGHSRAVFIIEYNYIDGLYWGSLKRAETINPYKDLFKFPPSTVLRGIASNSHDLKTQQSIIDFPNFAYGTFDTICKKTPLRTGQTVDTIISFFDLRRTQESLGLELPEKHSRKNFEQKYLVESIDDIKQISKIDPTRLDHGSIISVHLTTIEPYGFWFSDGFNRILVTLTNISWDIRFSLSDIKTDDLKQIYIFSYDYLNDYYCGSLKHVGHNPYKELAQFESSTVFQGKIIDYPSDDVIICLPNNAIGKLKKDFIKTKNDKTIDVIVQKLSLDTDFSNLILETPEHHSRKKKFVPKKYVSI
jgi:hypothetical protein